MGIILLFILISNVIMKRAVPIVFISVIVLLGCVTFINGLKGTSLTTLQYPKIEHNAQTVMVDTAWSSSAETPILADVVQDKPQKRTFMERVRLLINHLNVYTKEWVAFGMFFVEDYGLLQKVMQRKLVETGLGGVTLQDNGQLAFVETVNKFGTEEWMSLKDLSYRNDSVENFFSYIKENTESDFYYIITPYKVAGGTRCPYGMFEEGYVARSKYVERLKNGGFPVLDMNEALPENRNIVFYNTDHHWRIEYAFSQLPVIADFLNMSDSIYASENWTLVNSGKEFKGSLSVQVGDKFSNLRDTLYYYVPNFPTCIHADYYEDNRIARRVGTFRQTVLFEEYLTAQEDSRYTNLYMICSLGTSTKQKIHNDEACTDQRILIFADSFGAPIISYLSVLFREIDVIDLRAYKKRDIRKIVRDEDYDKVICIYNTAVADMFMFE